MNLKKEFNRLSGMFGDGVEKAHSVTDDFGDKLRSEASTMVKRAQRGLRQRRGHMLGFEEKLERHMQENATLYIVAGLVLLGLFIARVAMSAERTEMYRDW